jgi:8-oxo-dGTP diphosphatase
MINLELSGCVILDDKERILLLWKIKHEHYELAGGKMEENEIPEVTAIREVREEIGCEVDIIKYIGCEDFEINDMYIKSHKFIAKLKPNNEPKIMEKDVFSKIFWMPIKDYEKYSIAPNVKQFCVKYLKREYD